MIPLKSIPYQEQEIKENKKLEKDESTKVNVEHISKSGNLSPRQIGNIMGKKKKVHNEQKKSQINTRRKKDFYFTYD